MAVTSPWGLPLVDDTVQITPIQNFFNSISNAMNTAMTTINTNAIGSGFKRYNTRALMDAAPGTNGDHAAVTADSAAINNRDWRWSGGAWIPVGQYSTYVGTFSDNTAISNGGNHNTTVNFPAGKFTQPPLVFLLGSNARFTMAASSISTTSMTVSCSNWSSAPGVPGPISYLAIQALPGSSVG